MPKNLENEPGVVGKNLRNLEKEGNQYVYTLSVIRFKLEIGPGVLLKKIYGVRIFFWKLLWGTNPFWKILMGYQFFWGNF